MNHAMVASKVTQTFHTKGLKWLHQEAWQPFHMDIVLQRQGFDNQLLKREYQRNFTHIPKSKSKLRDAVITVGRWILVDQIVKAEFETSSSTSDEVSGFANLQWQSANFQYGFLDLQLIDKQEQSDAVLFFIAAIFLRISPDCLYVTGCDSILSGLEFPRKTIYVANRHTDPVSFVAHTRFEIDSVQWKSFIQKQPKTLTADLSWIVKQQKREEDLTSLKMRKPSTHWLTRLLKGLSGRSKAKKNPRTKSVHPIDRYKKPFIEWT